MDHPSLPRLIEQTIRNSIGDGCADLRAERRALAWGVDEFFEMWGALFPYGDDGNFALHANRAMNEEERAALAPLVEVLNRASSAANEMDSETFLQSPWSDEINLAAEAARAIMVRRGRFSQDTEEDEPTLRF